MTSITTYPFTDNFLDRLADDLVREFGAAGPPGGEAGKDMRRLAIVFPGKRPALFLRRELARRLGKSFYSPRFFSIDELIRQIVSRQEFFCSGKDLDQGYLLYRLAQKLVPEILAGRETFAQFLPWAKEIQRFIENIDLEQIADEKLLKVEASAEIGFDVPEEINRLLAGIVKLRRHYHDKMLSDKIYSRGFQYLRASQCVAQENFLEFDQIFFCNFFYFNRCEFEVVRSLYERGKARLFFQGDRRRWPVLDELGKKLGASIEEGPGITETDFQLQLCPAFDTHSQAGMAREILKGIPNREKTVVVLPNPRHLIPLLSEISAETKDFNVSMGYPLKRSSLFSLFDFVFKAQLSRREHGYYAHDYLKALRHPLVKNLKLDQPPVVTRILIHKIEEILSGQQETEISGSLFFTLQQIEDCDAVYELTAATLKGMGIEVSKPSLRETLAHIQRIVFGKWEGIRDFAGFAGHTEIFLDTFLRQSPLANYPLNLKIVAKTQDIILELKDSSFCHEPFPPEDIFKIFTAKVEAEIVAFSGSPLRGLQVLGLYETRALNFDNVIVLDVNEGVLPHLKVQDPLIPREVLLGLKLDRLEQDEEIQRYQFMRLISAAKKVHLIYEEGRKHERSRFVEELVWEEQKKKGKVDAGAVTKPSFSVQVASRKRTAKKTPAMIEFLRQHTFSASSINSYLRNPYEFYLNYVLGLKEKEDMLDEPENRQVGTFVHELLEDTFKGFCGRAPLIDDKFRKYFRHTLERRFEQTFARSMRSESFLLKSVLEARLERFLDAETVRDVKELLFVEKDFRETLRLPCGEVKFVYKLDRVDRMNDGTVLILDYKTGSVDPMPKAVTKIANMELSRQTIFENVKSFQIPLYFSMMDQHFPGEKIDAAFYNLRTAQIDHFFNERTQFSKADVQQAFGRALEYMMAEILDPKVDFIEDELS